MSEILSPSSHGRDHGKAWELSQAGLLMDPLPLFRLLFTYDSLLILYVLKAPRCSCYCFADIIKYSQLFSATNSEDMLAGTSLQKNTRMHVEDRQSSDLNMISCVPQ